MENYHFDLNIKDKIKITDEEKKRMFPLIKNYINTVRNEKQEKIFSKEFKEILKNTDNSSNYCIDIDDNNKLFEFMLKTLYFLKDKIIKKKRLNANEKMAIIKDILSNFCFKIKTYNGNLTSIDLNYEHVLTVLYKNKFKDDNEYLDFLHKILVLTGFNNHLTNIILIDYDMNLSFWGKRLFSYEGFKKGFKKTISYYSEPELLEIFLLEYKNIDKYKDKEWFSNLPENLLLNKNNFNKFTEIMKNNLYRKQIRMFNLDMEINNKKILEYVSNTDLKNKIRRYLNKK